jgi:hypothetical protein
MRFLADNPVLFGAVSFVVLWLTTWLGAKVLHRVVPLDEGSRDEFGVIQAATLTLLALIIGFTFSMATTRYDQRKNYEEDEANAIGTAYVRAELLPAPVSARLRPLLRAYLEQRIQFTRDRRRRSRARRRLVPVGEPGRLPATERARIHRRSQRSPWPASMMC